MWCSFQRLVLERSSSSSASQATCHHHQLAVLARPLGRVAVGVQLDAVAIRVVQVDRLAYPMVGGAVDGDAVVEQPSERPRQFAAVGVEDGEVVEAGGAARRRRTAGALPGVQPDMVVVAAGGQEGGLVAVVLHQFEAQHVAVEAHRAVKIRHLEVHVADAHARVDRRVGRLAGRGTAALVHIASRLRGIQRHGPAPGADWLPGRSYGIVARRELGVWCTGMPPSSPLRVAGDGRPRPCGAVAS